MIFINIAKCPVESFPTLNLSKAPAAACEGDPPLSSRDAVLFQILAGRTRSISREYFVMNNMFD